LGTPYLCRSRLAKDQLPLASAEAADTEIVVSDLVVVATAISVQIQILPGSLATMGRERARRAYRPLSLPGWTKILVELSIRSVDGSRSQPGPWLADTADTSTVAWLRRGHQGRSYSASGLLGCVLALLINIGPQQSQIDFSVAIGTGIG
jgi:hypothetical protein